MKNEKSNKKKLNINSLSNFPSFFSSLISHFSFCKGFTLIEIIVVFSIIVIITSVGMAAFVDYSRRQAVNAEVVNITVMLNLAKSRALSQIKPSDCNDIQLDGYKVTVDRLGSEYDYKLEAICEGSAYQIPGEDKNLSENLSFTNTLPSSFTFKVITGNVYIEGDSTIEINGYGITKTIDINNDGRIIVD